jgi:hypothetical protein
LVDADLDVLFHKLVHKFLIPQASLFVPFLAWKSLSS